MARFGLTISGLIFVLVIFYVFFFKKKYNDVKSFIFKILLILTGGLLCTELFFFFLSNSIDLCKIIACFYYFLIMCWFAFLLLYIEAIGLNNKKLEFKEFFFTKKRILLIFFILIGTSICAYLEVARFNIAHDSIYILGEYSVFCLYAIMGIMTFAVSLSIFKNVNKKNFIEYLPIALAFIVYILMMIIQVFYKELSYSSFCFAYFTVTLYFFNESQDSKNALELEQARIEAETADKVKSAFLAKISHEIRTPLNVIIGYSEALLEDKELNESVVNSDLKNIRKSGKNLTDIINNIIEFSKVEGKEEELVEAEYDISDIFNELQSYVLSKIGDSGVKFVIDADKNVYGKYFGDKIKIYRVLANALSNSMKYTDSGSIKLIVKCINLENNVSRLRFVVQDTGYGIKKELLHRIQNDFSDDTYENANMGLIGIGLVLTKDLVKLMNGTFEIDSEVGFGTSVTITIDQKVVGSPITDKKNVDGEGNFYFDCSNKKVLVVDDDRLNRIILDKLFSSYGVVLESLSSGFECVDKLKKNAKYDLILIDYMMPGLNGIETLNMIKKMGLKDLPPVIAITANTVQDNMEKYLEQGFDDYLSKPIDINSLNKLMRKYFFDNSQEVQK